MRRHQQHEIANNDRLFTLILTNIYLDPTLTMSYYSWEISSLSNIIADPRLYGGPSLCHQLQMCRSIRFRCVATPGQGQGSAAFFRRDESSTVTET